jgi:hypothetical protein
MRHRRIAGWAGCLLCASSFALETNRLDLLARACGRDGSLVLYLNLKYRSHFI